LRVEDHRPIEAGDLAGAQAGFDRQQDHRAICGKNLAAIAHIFPI
jgi:hypothetical protein